MPNEDHNNMETTEHTASEDGVRVSSNMPGEAVIDVSTESKPTSVDEEDAALRKRCDNNGVVWQDEIKEADSDVVNLLTAEDAIRLRLIPIRKDHVSLVVLMRDPFDFAAVDEASVLTGQSMIRVATGREQFQAVLETQYGTTAARMAERLAGPDETQDLLDQNIEAIETEDLHRMAEQPTLINLVNLIIIEAIKLRTSDVHVEPFEMELKIKYRIDGILHEQKPPPKHLQPAITSRIKIMSGMNIAERFVPQDGHITLRVEGRKIDIRVSTVPTLYGESVVLRILDKSTLPLDLIELGMEQHDVDVMARLIRVPHGMILVTGPTGSGKTTTLYACLQRLNSPEKKIITIEDPVEYELHGVNQIPVNPKRGLTFATGLRHILRQDPDIVMVGEIRDGETAEIAIRSALTGHLVFSTVHTNDAASAIMRLIDMEVEPFLVASVLEGILAQRLGRRICPECRQQVPIDEAISHRLLPEELALFNGKSWRGNGCDACRESGYRGRVGYFEILELNAKMRQAIVEGQTIREILACANEDHKTMRVDGLLKASRGHTAIEEVLKATQDTEEI